METENKNSSIYDLPEYAPPGNNEQEEKERLLRLSCERALRSGKRHASAVSIIMMIAVIPFLILSGLGLNGIYSVKDFLLWLLVTAVPIAVILFGICFIRGGSRSRIFFGIFSCIMALGMLAVVGFTIYVMWGAMGDTGLTVPIKIIVMILGAAMEFFPFAALCGYIFWTAFLNKDVKAYCNSKG